MVGDALSWFSDVYREVPAYNTDQYYAFVYIRVNGTTLMELSEC